MPCPTPAHLLAEHRTLEAEIREAFKGVTRDGGVSWSETAVIDAWGSEEACATARASDMDRGWFDLLEDERWDPSSFNQRWAFLDGIGFRYYLPAAMVRAMSLTQEEASCLDLSVILPGKTARPLFNERQYECVVRFVRFMQARSEALGDALEADEWRRVGAHLKGNPNDLRS
jgi:hypothetical protein